jgi:hypothetical protein
VSAARGVLRTIRSAGFIGPILVLSGFFDGTAAPKDPKLAGIAAYLFDDDGLARFRDGWRDLAVEFKQDYGYDIGHSFHAASCCGRNGHEICARCFPELRWRLCRKLAELTAATRLAGFAATCESQVYETFAAKSPGVAAKVGRLYPLTLLAMLDRVGFFARKRDEKVFYWLEQGDKNQKAATKILDRVADNEKLRERYAYITHPCVPKTTLRQ